MLQWKFDWFFLVELLLYCVVWLTLLAPAGISLNMAAFNFYIYGFSCYNESLIGFFCGIIIILCCLTNITSSNVNFFKYGSI